MASTKRWMSELTARRLNCSHGFSGLYKSPDTLEGKDAQGDMCRQADEHVRTERRTDEHVDIVKSQYYISMTVH